MNTDDTSPVKRSQWSGRPIRSDSARVAWLRSIGITERHRFHDCRCTYCGEHGVIRINKGYSTTARMTAPPTNRWGIHDVMCIDHVVPLSKGGADDGSNFTFACENCNRRKGSRTDWTSPNGLFNNGSFVGSRRKVHI